MTNAELEKLVEEQAAKIDALSKVVDDCATAVNTLSETLSAYQARLEALENAAPADANPARNAWIDRVLEKYHAVDKPQAE